MAATTLQSEDGFAVELADDGTVSRVTIGDSTVPMKKPGGFSVADFHTRPEPQNLVDDGGFERVARPVNLDRYQQIDTTTRRSGDRSVRIQIPMDEPASSSLVVSARVRPGRRYSVGMWVRRKDVGTCGGFAVEKDAHGKPSGHVLQTQQVVPQEDDRWLPVTWEITTAKETVSVEVRVTVWKSHGTLWVDDFFVHEVDEGHFVPLSGNVVPNESGHTFTARQPDSGLAVTATYRALASCIRIDGEVIDTTGRDRAVGVRFSLPWDATGWTWHHDTEEHEVIGAVPVLRRTYRCKSGVGECSIYPWASLSHHGAGLSMAIPMDDGPRVFLLQHDTEAKETTLTFYFGLTPITQRSPSRARFSVLLFRHDPAWGMRSTVDHYMKLFPGVFAKRMPHEAYLNYANLERFDPKTHDLVVNHKTRLPDASDFGEGYVLVSSIHGCYQYVQTSFPDPGKKPSDQAVLSMLDAMARDGNRQVDAYLPVSEMLKKLVTGPRRELSYIGDTRFFQANEGYNRTAEPGWGLNFRVNEDPEVSPVLAARAWDAAAKHTKSPTRRPWDGAFTADSIEGYMSNSNALNYRREHFPSVSFPLTFGAETLDPAISNTIHDFLSKAWWPISEKGKVVIYGNSNSYEQGFTAPLVDLPMMESNWDVAHPGRLDRFFRAMYGKKVCRFWRVWDEKGHYGEQNPANVRRHFDRGLAYAFFPAMFGVVGHDPQLKHHRRSFRTYVPAIEELTRAGWEPIPHARTTSGMVVERFGNASGDDLHFTLRNDSAVAVETELVIDAGALRLPADGDLVAIDLLIGPVKPVAIRDGRLRIEVPAQGTRALWVGSRSQGARHGFAIAAALLEKFSRLFDTDMPSPSREAWEHAHQIMTRGESSEPGLAVPLTHEADVAVARLAQATKTDATIDRDKLLARVRAAMSWAPLLLSGISLDASANVQRAEPGDTVQHTVAISTANAGVAVTATTLTSVVAGIEIHTQSFPGDDAIAMRSEIRIPAAPARDLLPLLTEVRGAIDGRDFMMVVPCDLVVESRAGTP